MLSLKPLGGPKTNHHLRQNLYETTGFFFSQLRNGARLFFVQIRFVG